MNLLQRLKSIPWRELVEPSEPQAELQENRIRFVERNVGIPARAVVVISLLYYLFFTEWEGAVMKDREAALALVRSSFLVYMLLNIAVATLLVGMAQVPFRLIRWLVFFMAVADALFLSLLTVITGGADSPVYWVLLALIVRNAFSVPMPLPQIMLNLLVVLAYTVAGREDKNLAMLERVHQGLDPAAESEISEPFTFLARILLLLLITAVSFGVQLLLDRQRRAEAEAREFALRQEQLRSAGRLAAEIAHQIKNPLGIINNAAFTLQRNVKEGRGTITQQIKIIREEVERSDRILTELMDYAQLTEGKLEKVQVTEILEYAIERVFPLAAKFDVEIRRDYAPNLPLLLIQRRNIVEIIVNILQNAREAMNGRGTVEVNTHLGDNYTVVIVIGDSGPGIPPELREKIFEPYYTTKSKGSGLGLAIVKHNLEMFGGTIQVESELGKGSRFILQFPARTTLFLPS